MKRFFKPERPDPREPEQPFDDPQRTNPDLVRRIQAYSSNDEEPRFERDEQAADGTSAPAQRPARNTH